jgi:hypothetical protein
MSLPKIEIIPFPETQYYKEVFKKEIVVLHHTGSGKGPGGDYRHFLSDPLRIATAQIINSDGSCAQLFNSKYWGHHIGCAHANNRRLNQISIAVEIDSWGGLTYDLDKQVFRSWTKEIVPEDQVVEYEKSFRGFRFFQKYTPEHIESVRLFLLNWNKVHGIPLDYNEDMWDISQRALEGAPGIWSHTSYRKDKSDVHPQKELIEMLKGLSEQAKI